MKISLTEWIYWGQTFLNYLFNRKLRKKVSNSFKRKRKSSPKIRFLAPSRKSNNLQITANNMWLEPPLLPIYPIHNLHNRQNYDSIISKNPLLQQQQQDYRNRYNLINRPSGSCNFCEIPIQKSLILAHMNDFLFVLLACHKKSYFRNIT